MSKKSHLEKAELEKDLAQLTAQATMIGGAIQYVQQKLQQFNQPVKSEVSNGNDSTISSGTTPS